MLQNFFKAHLVITVLRRKHYNMLWKKIFIVAQVIMPVIIARCILFSKRNLDSHNKSCTMTVTEPTTPLIFMRNPVGLFHL